MEYHPQHHRSDRSLPSAALRGETRSARLSWVNHPKIRTAETPDMRLRLQKRAVPLRSAASRYCARRCWKNSRSRDLQPSEAMVGPGASLWRLSCLSPDSSCNTSSKELCTSMRLTMVAVQVFAPSIHPKKAGGLPSCAPSKAPSTRSDLASTPRSV